MKIEVLTTFDDEKQTVTLSSPWDGTATYSNHCEAEAAIQDALAHAAEIAGRHLAANKLRKLLLSIEIDDPAPIVLDISAAQEITYGLLVKENAHVL